MAPPVPMPEDHTVPSIPMSPALFKQVVAATKPVHRPPAQPPPSPMPPGAPQQPPGIPTTPTQPGTAPVEP